MKKQIISLLLALVMVAGLLPGISLRASAEEAAPVVTYNLWVAGEQFTSDNLIITDENGGTAEYDPGTNSLVLTNFTASASDLAIHYESYESTGCLHVVLEGENVLTAETTAIDCLGSLEIIGTGSLTAESNGITIHSTNNLTISQCTVTLVSANFSPIFVPNGSISMINSTVSATAYDSYTLETYSPISITESTFIASSNAVAMNTNDILAEYSGGYHWRTERNGKYSQVALHYDSEAYFEIKPYDPEAEDIIVYFDSIWDNTYAICTYDDSSSTVVLPQENGEDDASGLLTFFIPNNTVSIIFTNTHVGQPPESTAEGKTCTVTVEAPEYGATYYSYNTYPLWIGGEIVKEISLSGDGWSYDPDTHTLTLQDFHLTVDEEAENIEGIYAQDDLTVVLKGNNTITATGLDCDGICVEGVLTIQGDGSLTIESDDDSLYSQTEIIIQSGTLDLTSLEQEAIDSVGSLTINGGTITVDADDDAIEASEFITVNGGSFTITGKDDGFDASGSLTINDGTICIAVRDNALEAEEDLVINGGTIEIIAYEDNDPALVVFGGILLDESIELPEGSTIGTITETYEDGYTETYQTILDKDGVPLAALTLKVKTGPETTEPEASEPETTEPEASEPETTEPEETKPSVPECDKDDNCVLSDFTDIVATEWYHDGIHFCVEQGIMNGMGEGKFAPNEATTRAQLVTMLYRLAGEPSVEGKEEPFTDVSSDDWFYASIVWAYENKVVNGVTATEFAPNANVTREQVATILHRYLGEPEGTGHLVDFPDASAVSGYAVAPLRWAVGEGLITGIAQADGTALLAPTGNATRAQIATILMRHLTK